VQGERLCCPVDVLVDSGIITKKQLEDWRFGRIPFLEAVCSVNLRKLSSRMHEMRVYAQKNDLKPSFCYYKRWGMKKKEYKPVIPLRFSKQGDPNVEKWYATHFVDIKRIAEIRVERQDHPLDEDEIDCAVT
jgi:hypothetical protein